MRRSMRKKVGSGEQEWKRSEAGRQRREAMAPDSQEKILALRAHAKCFDVSDPVARRLLKAANAMFYLYNKKASAICAEALQVEIAPLWRSFLNLCYGFKSKLQGQCVLACGSRRLAENSRRLRLALQSSAPERAAAGVCKCGRDANWRTRDAFFPQTENLAPRC
jgi:hypothetical protein